MGYGLKITNPSGELVISSDAFGLYCIGKAVLQGSVGTATGTATSGSPGRTWGTSKYRISHDGPIICAIDTPVNKRVGIVGISQPSAGVWDIEAYCADTPDSYGIDGTYSALDVWAFGLPTTAPSTWGMALFTASGAPAYDLTRSNPLFPRASITSPAQASGTTVSSSVAIPSLTRPVVLGHPVSATVSEALLGANHRAVFSRRSVWMRTSSTAIETRLTLAQRYEYFGPDSLVDSFEDLFDTPAFILEGAGLP